ncbi:IS110 family transposase [Paenarthrobacter aromaticivorans]|uniref:IS110 family transposase n=1 Tax=Paenarthrobacter aromaticivorans TaxID=2849150 RepID=A0ABS6IBL9_9MICC|nr:IS110 family transposase [Paenarthrobacter sp. MMS21-TAE1-1]MBU8867784.1 IS110 family transposase [Paenarthrobacter sp. MMS21-TAE1-1]
MGFNCGRILDLRNFLERQNVTTVAVQATGDYWKPFYYVLENTLPVLLVKCQKRPQHPGRKADVSDAAWLAQLAPSWAPATLVRTPTAYPRPS